MMISVGLACAALARQAQPPAAQEVRPVECHLRHIQAKRMLLRDVTGTYDQHPQVIQDLFTYAGMQGLAMRELTGIYLDDPDQVEQDKLRWRIALVIGEEAEIEAESPYSVKTLPAIDAVVYRTTLADLEMHAEQAEQWMQGNGWTPTDAAVRMVYLNTEVDPRRMAVEVQVPVAPEEEKAAADATLDDLRFIVGEWRADVNDGVMIERWSEPLGDAMLGGLQWVQPDGATRMYELITIQKRDAALLLHLRHFGADFSPWEGERPLTFTLSELTPHRAVFTRIDEEGDVGGIRFERSGERRLIVSLLPRDTDAEPRSFAFTQRDASGGVD